MQTIVLAAGEGTRMHPLTESVPKPILPVAGKPLDAHTIDAAIAAGATEIVLVVGYEAETVREYFGAEYAGVPITYVFQESQDGTADAVAVASEELTDNPFVVLNGDGLYDHTSLSELYDAGSAVGSYRVDNPSSYGVLHTTDDETQVTSVTEKPDEPPSNLINTGAYVFPAEAQEWLDVGESERGELELTDVLERACEQGHVSPVPFDRWLDVGRPWELLEANEWKLDELGRDIAGDVSEDAHLRGDVVVEDGATIEPGVVIEGPALISEGATVGPNAYIRGSTYVGPDVHVGHSVEIKNSILMQGTNVGHLSYVGDSVLGRAVNFGAGTNVANLRHDDEPVKMRVKGNVTSTGRRKFGVVVGDEAKTGINTSLNTGVKIDADGFTKPGETLLRDRTS